MKKIIRKKCFLFLVLLTIFILLNSEAFSQEKKDALTQASPNEKKQLTEPRTSQSLQEIQGITTTFPDVKMQIIESKNIQSPNVTKGITTPLPDIKMQVIESKNIHSPALIQNVPKEITIDYSKEWFILPAGSYMAVKFNKNQEKLEVIKPDLGVSNSVLNAVNSSPKWLQPALLDNIRRLTPNKQNTFAQIILNASMKTRDEIAFQVAHLSPQTLNSIDPNLLVDNAEYIYTIAPDLQYVQLVEYNSNTPNWYTTTKYRVLKDGDSVWVEIPKEIYYWWIVMPKLSDEEPLMDASVYNEFWRKHLYYNADPGYPILKDVLKNTKIMWDCKPFHLDNKDSANNKIPFSDTMSAVQVLGRWVAHTIFEKAKNPRPIQPNQILHDHNGNCGELEDLLNAGARTALLPVRSVGSWPGDHVWNELYWEGEWWYYQVSWECGPTDLNQTCRYLDKGLIFGWRGDGYTWMDNELYQPTCLLTVRVVDQSSKPVDGAQVTSFSAPYSDPHSNQFYLGSWLYTDENGELDVLLGTNINYGFRVDWSGGHSPAQYNQIYGLPWNQEGFVEGGHLAITIPTEGNMPPGLQIINQNAQGLDHYKFNIDYQVPYRIIYGESYWQADFKFDDYQWNDFRSPGHIDFFICDEENYQKFLSGEPFNAYKVSRNSSSKSIEFSLPEDKDFYIVYSNKTKNITSQLLQTKVVLSKNIGGSWVEIDNVQTADTLPAGLPLDKSNNSTPISVYPNPTTDYVTISLGNVIQSEMGCQIKIYNTFGECVITESIHPMTASKWINVEQLPAGVYYVVIGNYAQKFMVVR